jgi:hypothetical protein
MSAHVMLVTVVYCAVLILTRPQPQSQEELGGIIRHRHHTWDDEVVLSRQFSAMVPPFDPRPGQHNVPDVRCAYWCDFTCPHTLLHLQRTDFVPPAALAEGAVESNSASEDQAAMAQACTGLYIYAPPGKAESKPGFATLTCFRLCMSV